MCAGWLGHTDPGELLAVRLGDSDGDLDAGCLSYRTDVSLWPTGAAAAHHGLVEVHNPGPAHSRRWIPWCVHVRHGRDEVAMGWIRFQRRVRAGRRTTVNLSKSGASVSKRAGRVTVNSRGRASIRTPVKGLSIRFKL